MITFGLCRQGQFLFSAIPMKFTFQPHLPQMMLIPALNTFWEQLRAFFNCSSQCDADTLFTSTTHRAFQSSCLSPNWVLKRHQAVSKSFPCIQLQSSNNVTWLITLPSLQLCYAVQLILNTFGHMQPNVAEVLLWVDQGLHLPGFWVLVVSGQAPRYKGQHWEMWVKPSVMVMSAGFGHAVLQLCIPLSSLYDCFNITFVTFGVV